MRNLVLVMSVMFTMVGWAKSDEKLLLEREAEEESIRVEALTNTVLEKMQNLVTSEKGSANEANVKRAMTEANTLVNTVSQAARQMYIRSGGQRVIAAITLGLSGRSHFIRTSNLPGINRLPFFSNLDIGPNGSVGVGGAFTRDNYLNAFGFKMAGYMAYGAQTEVILDPRSRGLSPQLAAQWRIYMVRKNIRAKDWEVRDPRRLFQNVSDLGGRYVGVEFGKIFPFSNHVLVSLYKRSREEGVAGFADVLMLSIMHKRADNSARLGELDVQWIKFSR